MWYYIGLCSKTLFAHPSEVRVSNRTAPSCWQGFCDFQVHFSRTAACWHERLNQSSTWATISLNMSPPCCLKEVVLSSTDSVWVLRCLWSTSGPPAMTDRQTALLPPTNTHMHVRCPCGFGNHKQAYKSPFSETPAHTTQVAPSPMCPTSLRFKSQSSQLCTTNTNYIMLSYVRQIKSRGTSLPIFILAPIICLLNSAHMNRHRCKR